MVIWQEIPGPHDVVSDYLKQQPAHHGYDTRSLPPVYVSNVAEPTQLTAARASFELDHHLVFATSQRKGVFGSRAGEALGEYWLKVAAKHGFAIDQVSIVPDHAHLRVRIVPKMSIEECVLLLMNNGQYFIGKYYPQLLIESGLAQLWQPSAYAGTIGDYTSGLIQKWLSSPE